MLKYLITLYLIVIINTASLLSAAHAEELFHQPYIKQNITHLEQKITKVILNNGLTLLCYSMPNSYKVYVGISYDVGGKDETKQEEFGFAHAIEHMLFKGTNTMSETDLQAITSKLGIGNLGQGYNAFTSHDKTHYYFLSDKNNWHFILKILADCMVNAKFDKHHFASEVKAIFEEVKMRKAQPTSILFDFAKNLLFHPIHPYHHPIIGYKEQLIATEASALKEFYNKHYCPQKTTLIVVGDIDTDNVIKDVKTLFELITKEAPAASFTLPPQEVIQQNSNTIFAHVPTHVATYFWQLPAAQQENTYEIANYLEYALQEMLHKKLIDEKHLAQKVSVQFIAGKLNSMFMILVQSSNKIQEATDNYIKNCITDIIDNNKPHYLTLFRNAYTSYFLHSFEHCKSASSIIADLTYYLPQTSFSNHLEQINTLTEHAIASFCKKHLSPNYINKLACSPISEADLPKLISIQNNIDIYDQALLSKKQRLTPIEEPLLANTLPPAKLLKVNLPKPTKVFTTEQGMLVNCLHQQDTAFTYITLGFKNQEYFSLHNASQKQSLEQILSMKLLEEINGLTSKHQCQDFFDTNGISCTFNKNNIQLWFPKHLLYKALKKIISIIQQASYPKIALDKHVKKIEQQLKQSEIHGSQKTQSLLVQHLFQNYPWVQSNTELLAQLSCITREKLLAFKNNYIVPNNMILTIVGNFDDTIQQELTSLLSPWQPHHSRPSQLDIPPLNNPTPKTIYHNLPQQQINLIAGRITHYKNTSDELCLRLLEQYLNNKLFEIREQTGLFYTCHAATQKATFLTKGYIYVKTLISPDVAQQAEQKISDMLSSIAKQGISLEDFNNAKFCFSLDLATFLGTNQALTHAYNYLATNNQNWSYFDNQLKTMNAINLEQINKVAKTYCDPSTWTFVHVGRNSNTNDT